MAHALECARCHRRWQDEQVLSAGLRAFAANTANAEAPARLKQTLRAAFDEQAQITTPSTVVPFPGRTQRWPRWALAAAAALLVMVGNRGAGLAAWRCATVGAKRCKAVFLTDCGARAALRSASVNCAAAEE
jgi:hypothetical protein